MPCRMFLDFTIIVLPINSNTCLAKESLPKNEIDFFNADRLHFSAVVLQN